MDRLRDNEENDFIKPNCSTWSIWEGLELEGNVDIGVKTLFIRNCSKEDITKHCKNYTRIWFCEEFKNWELIRYCKTLCPNINLAVYYEDMKDLPVDIFDMCRLYVKLNLQLKHGDQLGVGKDFRQEFFVIDNGIKIDNTIYHKDVFIQ